jgi:cephalosporin-C deacetylase-like acetyl esterase
MANLNRRSFLMSSVAASIAVQPDYAAVSYSAEYPDMLLAHVTGKLNSLAKSWDIQRARIQSQADVQARNAFVREKVREMIHGYPDRTPLAPETVTTHERLGYRIENVMFQSRPNFWVTGNLYVPSAGKGPYPGVISPCGHYPFARMEPDYQMVYIDLVKAGFVVLAYDPIGEGERRHYWNPQTGETEVATASTYEHSMPGHVLLLMGEDLTHYRIWDGMRAIDYLQQRPEVDANRIACAGHSGGSTLTLFISALDERVKCAVVNEGGTGHRWPIDLKSETRVGPADVEQNMFPAAKYGIDMPDLHIAIAPRPLLALIEEYNPRFNRAAEEIRTKYQQLGVPGHFSTDQASDPHAWTPKLRIATTQWLSRWLYDKPGPEFEADSATEQHETLYCTPNGSLRYSETGDDIFSLILKKQQHLPPHRDGAKQDLAGKIAQVLKIQRYDGPLNPRQEVITPRHGYSIEKLSFLSEPGIYIPTWVFVPKTQPNSTLLVFTDAGKQAEGMEFGPYESLVQQGKLVIACDVRGIGETRPPHPPASESVSPFRQLFDVETAVTYMTWYMDECLLGMRVHDVIRSMDYALTRKDVKQDSLQIAGKGAGALWVMFAAVLDPRMSNIVLERGLLSYKTLAMVDRYTHSTGIFARDLLLHFDVPQVLAGLAGRQVQLIAPVDHMKKPVDLETARRCYTEALDAFRKTAGKLELHV